MIPAPDHLRKCTQPLPDEARELEYVGQVTCPCGSSKFTLLHTGGTHEWNGETIPCTTEIDGEFFLRVVAKCNECQAEHLLLDMDFHGWNGFVCGPESGDQARQRPGLVGWPCRSCQRQDFEAKVTIISEGMEHAIEEGEGDVDESNWFEAFGWINIDLICNRCSDHHDQWISFETM